MEDTIEKINTIISDYVEGKFDEYELKRKILPFTNTAMSEKLVRTGNYIVAVVLDNILELGYGISDDDTERKAILNATIKDYYEEFKSGVLPHNTRLKFTYDWNSADYKLHVKNG